MFKEGKDGRGAGVELADLWKLPGYKISKEKIKQGVDDETQ